MTDRSKTVVMLIDWDNLQICHSRDAPGTELDLYALIALAQSYGTLVSARAYAEWNLASERLAVYKAGIEPVFAPVMRPEGSLREGKSLADTVMVAEGVDLLWTVTPDVFVLVTSDKDMIPLARIAKQRGAAVVVLGSDLTAIPLVEMSNVFITYRQLLRELDRVTELDAPSGRAPARERRGLREARRPGGEPYGSGQDRRAQGGMRAVAAPGPTVSAITSAPAPSAPATAPSRREESDRTAALAPVAPAAADTERADADAGASPSAEGGARRRRRRGGRGRGRTGEFAAGDDRLQEIEAALMAGLPLDQPLPAASAEALAGAEAGTREPTSSTDVPGAESPGPEAPAAGVQATPSRRRAPQPPRSGFGQVRRGVAFSEFGAPSTPPTTTEAAPAVTSEAAAAEPNDAGVGPAVEAATEVSVESGAASDGSARPTEAAEPTESTAGEARSESEPPTLSLVPAGATPEDATASAPAEPTSVANDEAAPASTGPVEAEALGEAGSPATAEATANVPAAEAGAPPPAADAAAAEPVLKPTRRRRTRRTPTPAADAATAEPAPKPTRRRRTRRTPTPAADAANG